MLTKSKALLLSFILGSTSLSMAGASLAATTHDHSPTAGAHALELNAGERWTTDAPLRKAMGTLNESMRRALPSIHESTLAEAQYVQLAEQIRQEASYMIANCKLAPEADAQLHLIIGKLLAGADIMAEQPSARSDGAVMVIGALSDYASYFADPGFTQIEH